MTPKDLADQFYNHLYNLRRCVIAMGEACGHKIEEYPRNERAPLIGIGTVLQYASLGIRTGLQEGRSIIQKNDWDIDTEWPKENKPWRAVAYSEPLCDKCLEKEPIEHSWWDESIHKTAYNLFMTYLFNMRAAEKYGLWASQEIAKMPDSPGKTELLAGFENARASLRYGFGCTHAKIGDVLARYEPDWTPFQVQTYIMRFDGIPAPAMGMEVELCDECKGKKIDVT